MRIRSIRLGKAYPGGGAAADDADLAATVRREFKEESGLDLNSIVVGSPLEHTIWILFLFHWKTLLYEARPDWVWPGNRFHEFSEVRQIPVKDLHSHPLAFGVRHEVRAFLRNRRK